MATTHCFTSASFAYLDRASILADTIKRLHPDWKLWLCLSDQEPPATHFDHRDFGFDDLVRIDDLENSRY